MSRARDRASSSAPSRRSGVRPRAVISSRPLMSPAARSAFRMASSVASAAAWKSGVMYLLVTICRDTLAGGAESPARGMPRLPVAKAKKISPLPLLRPPPIRPRPMPARTASRSHWEGRSGASVARTTIMEPVPAGWVSASSSKGEGMISVPSTRPTGKPLHAQHGAASVVRLHERADRPAALLFRKPARSRADTALELVADHTRPPSDRALLDGSDTCGIERFEYMIRRDVLAVDIVQGAVVGLGHHGEAPVLLLVGAGLDLGPYQGVAHDTDAVGVGDRDRCR